MAEVSGELVEVVNLHRYLGRNNAGLTGCRGCRWQSSAPALSERGKGEYALHLAAALAPVVAGAVERAVEETAVRVECEATNAGTARDFMLAEAARLVREGGQPS